MVDRRITIVDVVEDRQNFAHVSFIGRYYRHIASVTAWSNHACVSWRDGCIVFFSDDFRSMLKLIDGSTESQCEDLIISGKEYAREFSNEVFMKFLEKYEAANPESNAQDAIDEGEFCSSIEEAKSILELNEIRYKNINQFTKRTDMFLFVLDAIKVSNERIRDFR